MVYENCNVFVIIIKNNTGGELNDVMSETILNKVMGTQMTHVKRQSVIFK